MPGLGNNADILPSLLDRLLDDEPDVQHESLSAHFQTLRQLKYAVTRDLEALLNTRQETLEELPDEFAELRHSLLVYGLPDFTALSLIDRRDRNRICRALERTITMFEPRLERVRVTLETTHEHDQVLHFRIDALLCLEPAPEPVTFDAMLLNTQEYVVQGHD
jgi:type VI secretion system protein ImpF